MRIMLDENIPRQIESVLHDHTVSTIEREGWKSIQNGALLDRIEDAFDVLITSDSNMLYQNRFVGRRLSLIVLPTNSLTVLRANAIAIVETLSDLEHVEFCCAVEIGWKGRRKMRRLDLVDAPFLDMVPVPPFSP
jgi:predicted nuclease of predicted toxin-antitoxin system